MNTITLKNTEQKLQKILTKLEAIEQKLNLGEETSLDDFIAESEAKELLGRGTTWFWNLRQTGFPYTKLGGQVYYNKKDLINYLENNKRG